MEISESCRLDRSALDAAYRRLVRDQMDPGFIVAVATAVGLFGLAAMLPVLNIGPHAALASGVIAGGLWIAAAVTSRGRRSRRRADIALLARGGDPRVVAPLLEEMRFLRSRLDPEQSAALARLLPRVDSGDLLFRHAWYQEALHYALLDTEDPELLIGLLSAMREVSDGRGLGYVRMLAENAAHRVRDSRVSDAARSVLPTLRTRAGISPPAVPVPHPTLLRPASGAGEHLVRPAAVGTESLVRAMPPP